MLVVGMTACGKTHYLLKMLEKISKGALTTCFENDIFEKQNLPGVEIPRRSGRVRGALRPRLRGNRPGNHRRVREGNELSHSLGRLRVLPNGEKQNQRVGKTCLPRKAHRTFHDSSNSATHEHRETLQGGRLQGCVLLHRSQGRSQGYF